MTRTRSAVLLSFALLLYVAVLYLGLGVSQNETSPAFWQPTGFLRDIELFADLRDRAVLGAMLVSSLPALGFALSILLLRSPIAIGIAAVACVTSLLFGYYGLSGALRIWAFFDWRGSVVLATTGLGVGLALAAPWLGAAWLRLGATTKTLVYAPIFIATVSLIRNATGTDESLFFNISPWPAIPVLGLEIGAYTLAGLWLGLAVGLGILALNWSNTLGFCIGAVLPVIWFQSRFAYSDAKALGLILGVSAGAMFIAMTVRSAQTSVAFGRRAAACGVAAALVASPLIAGRGLAEGDYAVTRHVRAARIIDALARHYADHEAYPDSLDELVEGAYLEAIPTPRIGFSIYYAIGWLEPLTFHYQNLGSSYIIEFVSTEWVMCNYNPPWPEDAADAIGALDAEEYEDAEDDPAEVAARTAACQSDCERVCQEDCDEVDAACERDCRGQCVDLCAPPSEASSQDDAMGEAWTCPDARPELW